MHWSECKRNKDESMKIYAFRLTEGSDLKQEIIRFGKENNIQAGFIITCVAGLKRATLRMADDSIIKDFEEKFEVVSLVGTISKKDVHLHICLSDKDGKCIGGHVKDRCIVATTAEIIIGESEDHVFLREFDEKTGFDELIVKKPVSVP